MESNVKTGIAMGVGTLLLILGGVGGCLAFQPIYSVWEQQKAGEAELARADSNRKIATLEANAKLESSRSLALAEIERAKGVAESNKIIGEGLKGHEEYLRYLWIMSLEHAALKGSTVVYIPTEANLPILEAGRLVK
mgnify:CR=1 FL=1